MSVCGTQIVIIGMDGLFLGHTSQNSTKPDFSFLDVFILSCNILLIDDTSAFDVLDFSTKL